MFYTLSFSQHRCSKIKYCKELIIKLYQHLYQHMQVLVYDENDTHEVFHFYDYHHHFIAKMLPQFLKQTKETHTKLPKTRLNLKAAVSVLSQTAHYMILPSNSNHLSHYIWLLATRISHSTLCNEVLAMTDMKVKPSKNCKKSTRGVHIPLLQLVTAKIRGSIYKTWDIPDHTSVREGRLKEAAHWLILHLNFSDSVHSPTNVCFATLILGVRLDETGK